jgi:transcriptional regulator with PAS, ATPase and Fis domain
MSAETKPKRSIKLSKDERKFLADLLKQHNGNKTAAGLAVGISKDVFDRTLAFGSCSEKTYNTLFSKVAA